MKIFRLWGFPIHKMLSDAEFVEKTRKGLRLSKKFIWIHVVVLLFLSVFVPWLIGFVQRMIKFMPDEAQKWAWLGLLFGFLFGAFIAQYVVLAGQSILIALDLLDTNRGSKLLIKYHHMLKKARILEEEVELASSNGENDGRSSDTWPRQTPREL